MEEMSYPKNISDFIENVIRKIRLVLNPEIIILAGSFGKKAWLYDQDRLLSDFEFVFITKTRWSLKTKKKLLSEIRASYHYNISLKGYLLKRIEKKIGSNYSLKYAGYVSLDFFDTFSSPCYLYSKEKAKIALNIKVDELPIWEAWRIVVNRIADLLYLNLDNTKTIEKENYNWLKLFESIADAYLIVNKKYISNINQRLLVFQETIDTQNSNISTQMLQSLPILENAILARSKHELSTFELKNLSYKERHQIVKEWLNYFQNKLAIHEKFNINSSFHMSYFNNRELQKKHLENNSFLSIQISNLIRIIFNYRILKSMNLNFSNYNYSWRHLSLLSISCCYLESISEYSDFNNTRFLLKSLTSNNEYKTVDDILGQSLKLWKILR